MTTTTTTNAYAILIVRTKRHRNDFTGFVHSAKIDVLFLDDEGEEIGCKADKTFSPNEGAKARAYAIKASEKQGIRLLGLSDFDAGN